MNVKLIGRVTYNNGYLSCTLNEDGTFTIHEDTREMTDDVITGEETKCHVYLHLDCKPIEPPTEAQIKTLALIFLDIDRPILGATTGATVQCWAFAGYNNPDELSKKYGTGKKVYLA